MYPNKNNYHLFSLWFLSVSLSLIHTPLKYGKEIISEYRMVLYVKLNWLDGKLNS